MPSMMTVAVAVGIAANRLDEWSILFVASALFGAAYFSIVPALLLTRSMKAWMLTRRNSGHFPANARV